MSIDSDPPEQKPIATWQAANPAQQRSPAQTLPEPPIRRVAQACAAIDRWAAEHPAHPRVAPWAAYVALMTVASPIRDWNPWTYVPSKAIQLLAVVYLVWRFRHLVPEVTLRFHWTVFPVSAALTICWIRLNGLIISAFPSLADSPPGFFQMLKNSNEPLFWAAALTHLVVMCSAVPLVEEVFNRSLILRMASDSKGLRSVACQLICDLPIIGERIGRSDARQNKETQQLSAEAKSFGEQFHETPLGKLTIPGVIISTTVFMLAHATADWPGAVLCGVTWCVMLQYTRKLGLGPVIWSHATVNALLWIYVMSTGSFRFI